MAANPGTSTSFVAEGTTIVVRPETTMVLENNPNRVRYVIQNTSGVVYIRLGGLCTPEYYSYRLPTSAVLEDQFQGEITACILADGDFGIIQVTEEI